MITQFNKKRIKWLFLPGFFLLIALGLCIPKVVSAQTVPPPPPIEQRWEMVFQNHPMGPADTFMPASSQSVYIPWSRVAFQSCHDGNWEIYAGSDNFLTPARLTNNGGSDIQPRMNRGATLIVFASNRDGDYEIFRMNFDGSGLTRLTDNTSDDVSPIWSPDGTKILFQSYRDGQAEIYVMNADGSRQTRLTNDAGYDGQPDWSPDGSKILFSSNRSGGYRIWVANADGSTPVMLSNQNNSSHPKWSPDGTRIAYDADSNGDGWQELWIMNADGSNPYCVAQSLSNADYWVGSWSPTGDYVAFTYIVYSFYQNNWFWTTAVPYAVSANPDSAIFRLGYNYDEQEWNPDWQTTDVTAPVSEIAALPTQSPATFLVSWHGNDDEPLGGVKGYDLQVRDGWNGTWTPLLNRTNDTSSTYHGIGGHTYFFRVRAWDSAYNVESWPADYDTFTTVEALPPVTSVNALPPFSRSGFTLSWGGNDPGESGIIKYDVQYRVGTDGTWTDLMVNTQNTSFASGFDGNPGNTYYFRSRATDAAQNVEPWPGGNGDTQVTIYSWKISGIVHDNVGVPLMGSQMSLDPALAWITPSDSNGNFIGYGWKDAQTYTTTWIKDGYGILPATTFPSSQDIQYEVALPPVNNLIRDGYFKTGNLSPENWQSVGALHSGITNKSFHTDQFAAQLGEIPAKSWTDTETVGLSLYHPRNHIAVDSKGVIHAVWVMGINSWYDSEVFYSSKPQDGPWTTPVNISNMFAMAPDITIDRWDNLHVVWSGGNTYYTSKPKDGNWTEPIRIQGGLGGLRIKVDATDTIHVVGSIDNTIQYASRLNGTWSTSTVASSKGSDPCLAVDLEGAVHVVWAEDNTGKIQYSYKSLNGTWTPAVQISSEPGWYLYPDLTVDSMGTLYGVWDVGPNGNGLNFMEFRTKPLQGQWGAFEKADSTGRIFRPQIVLNSGKIEIVYTRSGPGEEQPVYYVEKKEGEKWSTPVKLAPDWAVYPSIAVGPDEITHIVWYETVNPALSNATGVIKYRRSVSAAQTGDAVLTQTVTIPETMPTPVLAFFYQFGGGLYMESGFYINLRTTSGNVPLFSSATSTSGWTFQSLDVSAWRGQTVTLEFRTHQIAGGLPVWALVDDVSLGSAYSDIWGSGSTVFGHAGDEVTYILNCGNRGGVAANQAQMTVELPSDLTFVSAEPAPTGQTPMLTWDLGNLPPKSAACSVHLTVKIGPIVTIPKSLLSQVKLTTSSAELDIENNLVLARVIVPLHTYAPQIAR